MPADFQRLSRQLDVQVQTSDYDIFWAGAEADLQAPTWLIQLADGEGWSLGDDGDVVLYHQTGGALGADALVTNVIEGTADHQGVATDSLILSNITNDGDIIMLVSDGGDSKEFLLADADVADLQIGHGMATVEIKTASGNLTLNASANISLKSTTVVDNDIRFGLGTGGNTWLINRSTTLAADEEITLVIEGNSDHQGAAPNSLIISNVRDNGDIMMLVSDGGDSKEFLLANADVADLQIGHGMATVNIKTASGDVTLAPAGQTNITGDLDVSDQVAIGSDSSPTAGMMVRIENVNTGDITLDGQNVYAMRNTVNAAATAGNSAFAVFGGYFSGRVGSDNNKNLTKVRGVVGVQISNQSVAGSTGVITGSAGMEIFDFFEGGATLTNQYGIWFDDLDSGDNNYGIYFKTDPANGAIAGAADITIAPTTDLNLNPAGNVTLGNDALIQRDVNATLTASVVQALGQGPLTAEINEVSTVANPNDTVTLPSAVAGLKIVVINNGANTLQIFPASNDNLGAGVDAATTLASGSNIMFVSYDNVNWENV